MDGILLQKCLTVSDKRIYKDVWLSCICTSCKCTCKARNKCAKEAESGSDSECYVTSLHELLFLIFLLHHSVKDIESEHRESHLKHNQGHGHSPELVVHRSIVEPEFCEPHEVISPSKEDSNHSCRHKPPFLTSLAEDESEDEKEYGDGSHVHRACRKRLRSPVKRHMLECLAKIWLSGSFQKLCGL